MQKTWMGAKEVHDGYSNLRCRRLVLIGRIDSVSEVFAAILVLEASFELVQSSRLEVFDVVFVCQQVDRYMNVQLLIRIVEEVHVTDHEFHGLWIVVLEMGSPFDAVLCNVSLNSGECGASRGCTLKLLLLHIFHSTLECMKSTALCTFQSSEPQAMMKSEVDGVSSNLQRCIRSVIDVTQDIPTLTAPGRVGEKPWLSRQVCFLQPSWTMQVRR